MRRSMLAFVVVLGCATPPSADDELGSAATDASSSDTESSESDTSSSESTTETDTGTSTDPGDPDLPRVLFVGNSYTFVNDLPGLFAAMTEASGDPWIVDSLATAGASVGDHVVNPNTATKLAEGWDVVVLQGQSFEPIFDTAYFMQSVVDFAALVDATNPHPDADVVLYETWAREDGNVDLVENGLTPEAMQQGLTEAYAAAAAASGARVAPVGQAWAAALTEAPQIDLFATDGSHPSLAGSFLADCVFFGVITGAQATDGDYVPDGLPSTDADTLEPIADALVFP